MPADLYVEPCPQLLCVKQSKLESIFWPCFKVCLGGPGRGNEGGCKKELPKDEVQLGGINQAGHRVNRNLPKGLLLSGFVPFTSTAMTKPDYP